MGSRNLAGGPLPPRQLRRAVGAAHETALTPICPTAKASSHSQRAKEKRRGSKLPKDERTKHHAQERHTHNARSGPEGPRGPRAYRRPVPRPIRKARERPSLVPLQNQLLVSRNSGDTLQVD